MQTVYSHHRKLYIFSWLIVLYTVVIIAWGAWVRISGSGDGCGEHWPLCHGEAIPSGASSKTWTEVSHRYSTAVFGLMVLAQLIAVRKFTACGNPARTWVWFTLLFTVTEALIGRMLVVRGLVNESHALSRVVVMPLHLLNTSLLLFSEVMTAESVAWGMRRRRSLSAIQTRWVWLVTIIAVLLLTSGAIAALGSHLLPAPSLERGLLHDLQSTSPLAVRLRLLHPVLALVLPMAAWLAITHSAQRAPTPHLASIYRAFALAVLGMIGIGILTLTLLAPTWLKLAHLTMANVLVILATRCIFHTVRPE